MGTVMDMSSYAIERDNPPETGYGEEILCSGWNPAVSLACQTYVQPERQMSMPPDLATVDAEDFLEKMYACQR